MVTFLVATACYVNFYVHTFIILICFSFCVWNGATYYIEIFSSRYQQYISVAEETTRAFPQYAMLRRHPQPTPGAFDALIGCLEQHGCTLDVSSSLALSTSLDK